LSGFLKRVGKDRAYSSYKDYCKRRRRLASFLEYEYHVKDIAFKELKRDFIEKFVVYLSSIQGMRSGTIHSTVKKLKLMTYTAYKNGWIPIDPFASFRVKPTYAERRYLSASELQAVMDVQLPNYRTGINRDAFVFCAFTGLSHSDVAKLTHADIHTDGNGNRWIIDKRQKTGMQFRVKLLPVAEMLYNRYKDTYRIGEKVFPLKGTYKTLNMSLHHVAKHAGLSFNPTMHMARHTFATTVMLTQGVPLETVSKMLGHKRITTTQIYAKITNDKIRRDMAALSEKLNSVFKVAQ
jgi:integrase